jgi:hypothetical protein
MTPMAFLNDPIMPKPVHVLICPLDEMFADVRNPKALGVLASEKCRCHPELACEVVLLSKVKCIGYMWVLEDRLG